MTSNNLKLLQMTSKSSNAGTLMFEKLWEGHLCPKGPAEACDEFLASAIDVYQYLQQELMAADQIGHLEDVFSKATWKQCS